MKIFHGIMRQKLDEAWINDVNVSKQDKDTLSYKIIISSINFLP